MRLQILKALAALTAAAESDIAYSKNLEPIALEFGVDANELDEAWNEAQREHLRQAFATWQAEKALRSTRDCESGLERGEEA